MRGELAGPPALIAPGARQPRPRGGAARPRAEPAGPVAVLPRAAGRRPRAARGTAARGSAGPGLAAAGGGGRRTGTGRSLAPLPLAGAGGKQPGPVQGRRPAFPGREPWPRSLPTAGPRPAHPRQPSASSSPPVLAPVSLSVLAPRPRGHGCPHGSAPVEAFGAHSGACWATGAVGCSTEAPAWPPACGLQRLFQGIGAHGEENFRCRSLAYAMAPRARVTADFGTSVADIGCRVVQKWVFWQELCSGAGA